MDIATLRAAIGGLTDDGNSCRFFKQCEVLKNLTKQELADLIEQAWKVKYPGPGFSFSRNHKWLFRTKKLEVIRHLVKVIDLTA